MSTALRRANVVALGQGPRVCAYCGVGLADPAWPGTFRVEPPLTSVGGPCGCGEGVGRVCCGGCWGVEEGIAPLGDLKWATIDHIHPRAHGGSHDPDNLTLACLSCNSKKGAASHE